MTAGARHRRVRGWTRARTAHRIRVVRDGAGAVTGLLGVCRPLVRGEPSWVVRLGALTLDLAGHRATVAGRTLTLTPSEQQLLTLLASADRIVSRAELVERLWGAYHVSGERAVEVHISNLRKKLDATAPGALRLVTIRGAGYRLVGITAVAA